MATIELSNPNGKWQRNYLSSNITDFGYLPAHTTKVQQQQHQRNNNQQQQQLHYQSQQPQTTGAQLHKLLVNGTTGNITSVNSVLTAVASSSQMTTPEMARLPGGAELNILPAGTNGTSLYRSNGKLTAIVNNGFTFKG